MIIKIISILILFFILIYEFGAIVGGSTLKGINDNENLYKLMHIMAFLSLLAVVIAIGVSINSYYKNYYKVGTPGDKGMKGRAGNSGKEGSCGFKCGQKVCYSQVKDHMEKLFQDITKDPSKKIKNLYFLNKINKMCHSNSYQHIMRKEHINKETKESNKPNEKKLIEFMKEITEEWIKELLKDEYNDEDSKKHKGHMFLTSKNMKENIWSNDKSPFNEIKKYDIWQWTNNDVVTKQIVKKQCSFNQELPQADDPPLKIVKTNNYEYKYDSEPSKDKYGPEDCPYDQIGMDYSNPNNREYCIYVKEYANNYLSKLQNEKKNLVNQLNSNISSIEKNMINAKIKMVNKKMRLNTNIGNNDKVSYRPIKVRKKVNTPEGLSLYHPVSLTDNNGVEYYPLGSVWRGRTDKKQPKTGDRAPSGSRLSKDGEVSLGPIKETVLISGDIKSPVNYSRVWSSKDTDRSLKQDEFQPPSKNATIWRPIPPKGYTCIGDVVKEGSDKPDDNYVKCVPSRCVEEISIAKPHGDKIWDTSQMNTVYYNQDSSVEKTLKTNPLTLWSTGNYNAVEERNNRPNSTTLFEDDGGHNLFKSHPSTTLKPSHKAYRINPNCLYNPKPESLYKKYNDSGMGLTGGTKRAEKYSVFLEYGKPPIGIVRNTMSINSPSGNPKAYYIKDSKGGLCNGNSYFLKAYNKEKNEFTDSIVMKNENEIKKTDISFRNDPMHVWKIVPVKDIQGKPIKNEKTGELLVNLESLIKTEDGNKRYFKQEYDNNGISYESAVKDKSEWYFKSIVGDLIPSSFNTC